MYQLEHRARVMHLIATNFYGGPEKQIVEHLKRIDRESFEPVVGSFIEAGAENEILTRAAMEGIPTRGVEMKGLFDVGAYFRLLGALREEEVTLLCMHGYKANVMGHFAAASLKIPTIAFSRGYTAENRKVALYEWLERRFLGSQNALVAVSSGQLKKLKGFGISSKKERVV
ncbi:MAG: group 1 glycosyl transferase, partial [Deltaproteobacteria bacterium]